MSFMPREMNGQPLDFMQKFMDARAAAAAESPALPNSVEAFMNSTLHENPVVVGEKAEALKTLDGNPHSKLAEDGERSRGENGETAKEKEERKNREAVAFMRQQQELYAELAANVERYEEELEAAQLELSTAKKELLEAEKAKAASEAKLDQTTEKVEDAMAKSRIEGQEVKGMSVTIDGQTITMDSNRNYVGPDGKPVDADIVAQSDDPAAIQMEEARKAADAARMAAYQQYGASRMAGKEYEKVDEAAEQVEEAERTAQEAEQKLRESEQELEKFEEENPDVVNAAHGNDLVSSADTIANTGIAPPVVVASITPEQYEAQRTERMEATETTGFVGGQRIEVASLKLGGHFRSATIGDSEGPSQQAPQVTTPELGNSDMALDPNRYAMRANTGMSNSFS